MNKKVNVGVIGVGGRIGQVHMESLLKMLIKVKICGIWDIDMDMSKHYSNLTGATPYEKYQDMLEDKKIDAILVLTRTDKHHEIVMDCANAGKHIFCEKPLAETIEKAEEMVKAIKEAKVKFQIGYQRRFDPAYSESKKAIESGAIGKPLMFKSTSRDPLPPPARSLNPKEGGGPYLDMNTHDFDLGRWLMGSEIKSLTVTDAELLGLNYNIPNFVDHTIINLRFENNSIGVVDGSYISKGGYDMRSEVLGTEGSIFIGQLSKLPVTIFDKNGFNRVSTFAYNDEFPHFIQRFEEGYYLEVKAFIDAVLNDKETLVDEDDALINLKIAFAAHEASEKKCVVSI